MKSIACIIATHNMAQYLGAAVDSVLRQSRRASEIVVVDDASTDDTAMQAAALGGCITYLRNETNQGRGYSCNLAAAQTAADYLAFLDADDLWEADHLADLAGLLDRHEAAAVAFCPARYFGTREGRWPPVSSPCEGRVANMFQHQLRASYLIPSCTVLRKSAFQSVAGFQPIREHYRGKEVLSDDYDLFLRLSVRYLFISSPHPTTRYRWHAGQSSVYHTPQMIAVMKYALRMLEQDPIIRSRTDLQVMARDRILMHWESMLEEAWAGRQWVEYFRFVRYGRRQPMLRDVTWNHRTVHGLSKCIRKCLDNVAQRAGIRRTPSER